PGRSFQNRVQIWKVALKSGSEKPLLGSGFERFIESFALNRPDGWESSFTEKAIPDKTHNEILEIMTATGFIGSLFYLWFLILLFLKGVKVFIKTKRKSIFGYSIFISFLVFYFSLQTSMMTPPLLIMFSLVVLAFVKESGMAKGYSIIDYSFFKKIIYPIRVGLIVFVSFWLLLAGYKEFQSFIADVSFAKGVKYREQFLLENSLFELKKSVKLNRNIDLYWNELGVSYYLMSLEAGDSLLLESSEEAFKKAQELSNFNPEVYFNLGVLYSYWGGNFDPLKLSKARTSFKQALLIRKSARTYFELGITYVSENQMDKAIEMWEKAIEIDSMWIDPYYSLGFAYELLEDFQKAEEYFKKALTLAETAEEKKEISGKLEEIKKKTNESGDDF
ncbi:MAG: tetratricopeptide repeat protein, partial [Actinomycetia bacterium]|nr:tetratricopeptide repeat protein [Actinomycetes bacterium]